jgi:hypothetical protein
MEIQEQVMCEEEEREAVKTKLAGRETEAEPWV